MSAKKWIITISGKRSIAAVQKDLGLAGFSVSHTLEAIGCITGSGSDSVIKKVRSIAGVADVSEEQGPINIGPPDASITW
jgi:hypothetical protein